MKLVRDFFEQYNIVFTKDGEVKACGREACSELIRRAKSVNKAYAVLVDTINFGDEKTGYVNAENIKILARLMDGYRKEMS